MITVIDGSNLAYRAYHTFIQFESSGGAPTGMLYGFLSILNSYANRFGSSIVITWDKKPYWRKIYYPAYKESRKENEEFEKMRIEESFRILKEVLTHCGIVQIDKLTYEADDIIAFIVKKFSRDITVISGDKDLLSLMDESKNINVVRPGKKGLIKYNEQMVMEEFGVSKADIPKYLAIVGDKSDNIIGLYGFGPVKTAKLIDEHPDLMNKLNQLFPADFQRIKLNLELVDLKNPKVKINYLDIEDIKMPSPDRLKLSMVLRDTEIKAFSPSDLIENFSNLKIKTDVLNLLTEKIETRFNN